MKYNVGQVVYLLNNKEMRIFPARIEEEIIRRKASGEEVQYKIMLPTKSRDVVDLGELDATVFVLESDLRNHMIENAIKTIDSMIDRANRSGRIFSAVSPEPDHVRDESDVVE
jgi:hypothetical protein